MELSSGEIQQKKIIRIITGVKKEYLAEKYFSINLI
jgi:hypothetical protein